MVVLPASGCEMMAKVLRLRTSERSEVFDIDFYLPGKSDCRKPIKTPEEDSFTDKSVMLIIKGAHFRRFNRQKQSSDLLNAFSVPFPVISGK